MQPKSVDGTQRISNYHIENQKSTIKMCPLVFCVEGMWGRYLGCISLNRVLCKMSRPMVHSRRCTMAYCRHRHSPSPNRTIAEPYYRQQLCLWLHYGPGCLRFPVVCVVWNLTLWYRFFTHFQFTNCPALAPILTSFSPFFDEMCRFQPHNLLLIYLLLFYVISCSKSKEKIISIKFDNFSRTKKFEKKQFFPDSST